MNTFSTAPPSGQEIWGKKTQLLPLYATCLIIKVVMCHVHQRHLVVKSYTNLIVSRTYYLPFLISLILLLPRADLTWFLKDFTTCPPWCVPNDFCVASTMYKKYCQLWLDTLRWTTEDEKERSIFSLPF